MQDNFVYFDACIQDKVCIKLIEQYICSEIFEQISQWEGSPLKPLKNLNIRAQSIFANEFLVIEDLKDFFRAKLDPNCQFNIDYLYNSCPLTLDRKRDEDRLKFFNMSCMRFKKQDYMKFKDECLKAKLEDYFTVEVEVDKQTQQINYTLCYNHQGNYKIIKMFKKITKNCIIQKKCSFINHDKLREKFQISEIAFNQGFCSFKCEICSDFSECEKCKENFELTNGYCQCYLPNILIDGRCQKSCPENFGRVGLNCKRCIKNDCKNCKEDLFQCADCFYGFFLHENDCWQCSNFIPYCKNCLNRDECIGCADRYRLEDKKCILDCKEGEYDLNGQCTPCTPNCLKCQGNKTDKCLKCKIGYYLRDYGVCEKNCFLDQFPDQVNQICVNCHQNCNKCRGPTEKDCKECAIRDDICEDITDQKENQNEIKSMNKHCLQIFTMQNCKFCSNTHGCEHCIDNFYLDKNLMKCLPISQECQNGCETYINESNVQRCKSCKEDYFYDETTFQCCQVCSNGFYPDNIERKCQKCFNKCNKCIGPNEQDCIIQSINQINDQNIDKISQNDNSTNYGTYVVVGGGGGIVVTAGAILYKRYKNKNSQQGEQGGGVYVSGNQNNGQQLEVVVAQNDLEQDQQGN